MAASPRTIVYVHPSGSITGAGISLFALVSLVRGQAGYRVAVILPADGPLAAMFRQADIPVHVVPMRMVWELADYNRTALGRLCLRLTAWRNGRGFCFNPMLADTLTALQPDVVHINDWPLQSAGLTAAQLHLPVVWHVRHALHRPQSRIQARMIRNVQRIAHTIIGISQDEVVHLDPSVTPVRIVYNPAAAYKIPSPSDSEIAAIRRGHGIEDGHTFAYAPINATRTKGILVLLDAFKRLKDQGHSHIKLVVTGAVGESRSRIRQGIKEWLFVDTPRKQARTISRHGLQDTVSIVPAVSNVFPYLAACDFVLYPSLFRNLGRPVIEAAVMEKPAIVALDAPRDGAVIHGETGLIVPENDAGALADAIRELAGNPARRLAMGQAAKRHLDALCAPPVVAQHITAIYASILQAERERTP